jgi:hypothetical protein
VAELSYPVMVAMYDQVNSSAQAFQEDAEALKHNFLLRGFFKDRGYEDSAELTKNEIMLDAKGLFEKPDAAKLRGEKELKPVGQVEILI